jgi:sulfatase maturation enzyme AslB (radical SAM superfamily)
MSAYTNGDVRICCFSQEKIQDDDQQTASLHDQPMSKLFNNRHYQSVRKNMSENTGYSFCYKCTDVEKSGAKSKRQIENINWDGIQNQPPKVRALDIRFSNLCNLACLTCSSRDSSKWSQIYKQVKPNISDKNLLNYLDYIHLDNEKVPANSQLLDNVLESADSLQVIYFAGGEPFLAKEHVPFLKRLIEKGHSKQISLRYNTNGTIYDSIIVDLWKNFQKIDLSISIDGLDSVNEYIRYGSNWINILENINRFKKVNVELSITTTVSSLNVYHFPEVLAFFELEKIPVYSNVVFNPRFLNISSLTEKLKEKVLNKLQQSHLSGGNEVQLRKIENQLLKKNSESYFSELIEYLIAFDKAKQSSFQRQLGAWGKILLEN